MAAYSCTCACACSVVLVVCLTLPLLLPAPAAASPIPAPAPHRLNHRVPRALSDSMASACRCTREFNAVCANDGQTYSNKCMLECARATGASRMGQGLRVVHGGQC